MTVGGISNWWESFRTDYLAKSCGIHALWNRMKMEWGDKERRVSFGSKPFEQTARLLFNGSVLFDDGHEWVQLNASYDEGCWIDRDGRNYAPTEQPM